MVQNMCRLLGATGRLCLILPFDQADATVQLCEMIGLHLWSRTDVRPNPDSDPKRTLFEFATKKANQDYTELVVESHRHQFSTDYANLTRNFHLRYDKE